MPSSLRSRRLSQQLPIAEAIATEQARRRINANAATDVDSSKARCKSLAGFIREAWALLLPDEPYVHCWHIDLICAHLEAITFGKFLAAGLDNRVMFNIPPGMMKSLILMVFWPAWEWGPCGMSSLQYIATSFRLDNCERDQGRFNRIVTSDWFQERWRVEILRVGQHRTETARGGFRHTMPFGSLMGGRGHRLLVDDPHSIDQSESDIEREKAIRNFRETGVRRLNDPKTSAICIIMQRLHMRDLCGVILELGLRYVHVMLPMRFEVERACATPFGRDPRRIEGELLAPEFYPQAEVDRDEAAMTAYAVAGQNQQRPSPRGGAIFQRVWLVGGTAQVDGKMKVFPSRIVDDVPAGLRWVRGWDFAASVTATSPYTASALVGHDARSKKFYIGHVHRLRTENPEPDVVAQARLDGTSVIQFLPQDPGGAGKVQAKSIVAALVGFEAYASVESGDKVSRARPVASQMEIGNVSMVRGDWNNSLLDELESFPVGYKDRADALSRAFSRFILLPTMGMARPIIVTTALNIPGENHG